MAVQAIVLAPLGWLSAGHLLNWIPWAVIAGYLLRREWFLLQVNLHHVVKLNRDQDRFNKSIRDHRLSDGDAAIAVTLRYFGPRQVTIVDIGYRLYSRTFWGPSKASERTLHNHYVERWLIPAVCFDPKIVTTIFLTKEDQTRIVARVNYPLRVRLWIQSYRSRAAARRLERRLDQIRDPAKRQLSAVRGGRTTATTDPDKPR